MRIERQGPFRKLLCNPRAYLFSACVLFFAFFLFVTPAQCAASVSDWTWKIVVIPPDEGWDGNKGNSIRSTLLWHKAAVGESGDGLLGHDIDFVFLSPLTEDSVADCPLPFDSNTIAVFSFASYPVNRGLVARMKGKGLPLLLADGENVFFYEGGKLLPFVFALDLFRDYRCAAFVEYARKTLSPEARIGVIGTRFTLFEERDAKICYDLLSDAGFMPMPWWVDASVRNTFDMVEQEIKNYSEGILISYVGGMASREIWRGFMSAQSPYRIWYGGVPDGSFLSFGGIVFADQNMLLDADGGFEQLKRDLWTSRTVAVTDRVAAGRANALALWLKGALDSLREFDRAAFLSQLARTQGIPFGDQVLNINEETHRPDRRRVHILETRDRRFNAVESMDIQGLKYYDY